MSLVDAKPVDVVTVTAVDAYTLRLRFSDGHESIVDFGPFLRLSLNPQTRQFLDRAKFKSYALKDGNLVLGDYDMCFSIEQLYEGTIGVAEEPSRKRPLAVTESRVILWGSKVQQEAELTRSYCPACSIIGSRRFTSSEISTMRFSRQEISAASPKATDRMPSRSVATERRPVRMPVRKLSRRLVSAPPCPPAGGGGTGIVSVRSRFHRR